MTSCSDESALGPLRACSESGLYAKPSSEPNMSKEASALTTAGSHPWLLTCFCRLTWTPTILHVSRVLSLQQGNQPDFPAFSIKTMHNDMLLLCSFQPLNPYQSVQHLPLAERSPSLAHLVGVRPGLTTRSKREIRPEPDPENQRGHKKMSEFLGLCEKCLGPTDHFGQTCGKSDSNECMPPPCVPSNMEPIFHWRAGLKM